MPNYSKSKIYKLTSSNSNDIYIGSTIQKLSIRKAHHISVYKGYLLNKGHYVTSFKIIENGGDIDICLLEEYPCNNKEQLHQRERFYIEKNNCVNKVIPTRTNKEYYVVNNKKIKEDVSRYRELNKDKKKEADKIYRELNKDKIKQYKKEYYELELNKDKKKEADKIYRELNKDKIKQYRLKKSIEREQQMI
jgi:hypothetical protein